MIGVMRVMRVMRVRKEYALVLYTTMSFKY